MSVELQLQIASSSYDVVCSSLFVSIISHSSSSSLNTSKRNHVFMLSNLTEFYPFAGNDTMSSTGFGSSQVSDKVRFLLTDIRITNDIFTQRSLNITLQYMATLSYVNFERYENDGRGALFLQRHFGIWHMRAYQFLLAKRLIENMDFVICYEE